MYLQSDDYIGLICCSDINYNNIINRVELLKNILLKFNLNILFNPDYYKDANFNNLKNNKLKNLFEFLENNKIKMIFDISGGDTANSILEEIDFNYIKKIKKGFAGYSDITVLLNSFYKFLNLDLFYYNINNLYKEDSENQINLFKKIFFSNNSNNIDNFKTFNIKWINKKSMSGVIIGGNIRCFLKLAGTKYLPDPENKILFLESFSGGYNRILSYLYQLKQMNYFENLNGLLLGNFTELQKEGIYNIEDLIITVIDNNNLPIAITNDLGHNNNSHCLPIGKFICF